MRQRLLLRPSRHSGKLAQVKWPEIRAGLIALAIGFGLVDGCPLPRAEKTPASQRWLVEPIRDLQQAVLTPVAWLGPRLRIHQRWAVYQAPRVDRFRLWIEGADREGTWHIVFRASDPDHTEFADQIDYTRPRGAWDPSDRPPQQYGQFANWMTHQVLLAHPDYVAARLRLEKVRLRNDGFDSTGDFVFEIVNQRVGANP